MSPVTTIPVPDGEVAGVLAVILRNGADGTITQEAACFMATICAEHLVDQLGLAGYVVVRCDQLVETLGPHFSVPLLRSPPLSDALAGDNPE